MEAERARWLPAVLGLALALPFVPLFRVHPDGAWDLLTLLLVLGTGVRLGAAPGTGSARVAPILLVVLLVVLALLALFWSPLWLALGFVVLAAWTYAAHRSGSRRALPFGTVWPLIAAGIVLWGGWA